MPIDIKQFNAATQPLTDRIHTFLASHREQAYSLMEIMAELEGKDSATIAWVVALERLSGKGSETWDRYSRSIAELLQQKKVHEAHLQGTTYYAYLGANS